MKNVLLRWTWLWGLYPPFLGAGIRVARIAPDFRRVLIRMKLRFWNRNYVGTHYGGSLFSMCDPFYMIMLMRNLGPAYTVWDKEAAIRYRRPGRGTVQAEFVLPAEVIEEIRAAADRDGKTEKLLTVRVVDEAGETVAEVDKLLWVKRR